LVESMERSLGLGLKCYVVLILVELEANMMRWIDKRKN
jgi:hypothetical protein